MNQESTQSPHALDDHKANAAEQETQTSVRLHLPATRQSVTHRFTVAGHKGYLIVGFYENGKPGELFVKMAKEGSTIGGLMDAFGITVSMALQWGVPLDALAKKLSFTHFEPAGETDNLLLPDARSIIDYIARWLEMMFLSSNQKETKNSELSTSRKSVGQSTPGDQIRQNEIRLTKVSSGTEVLYSEKARDRNEQFAHFQSDAPPCSDCGSITVRNGNCYRCFNCGSSQGCS